MPSIAIIGAGSVVFAQKLISDILQRPAIGPSEFRLMDIDAERLRVSGIAASKTAQALGVLAAVHTTGSQREAVDGANYVINCVQVGGAAANKTDFEIPARYGLRQTIADTIGIGGIFRALRTYPMLMQLADDIVELGAPRCQLLNYTNPMAMNMLALLRSSEIAAVGLCHSVQGSSTKLAAIAGVPMSDVRFRCAGINHMAFFTEFRTGDRDLYPVVFDRVTRDPDGLGRRVRFEMMKRTGYFVTESSEHQAEYTPYFIHHGDEVIGLHDIPIDDLLRRNQAHIERWERQRREYADPDLVPSIDPVSDEYGSVIIEALESGAPATIYGNVLNDGLIDNVSREACVEVACHVDGTGVTPSRFGRLPTVLAGIVASNVAVQLATVEACESGLREGVYHAAMLDPHTAASLTLDQIWALCDELLDAHAPMLPELRASKPPVRATEMAAGTRAEVSVLPRSLPPEDGAGWPVTVRARNLSHERIQIALVVGEDEQPMHVKLDPVSESQSAAEVRAISDSGQLRVPVRLTGGERQVLLRPLSWPDRPAIRRTDRAVPLRAQAPAIEALSGTVVFADGRIVFHMNVADADPTVSEQGVLAGSAVTFSFTTGDEPIRSYDLGPNLDEGNARIASRNAPLPAESSFSCARSESGYRVDASFSLRDLGASPPCVLLFNVSAHLMATDGHGGSATTALFGWPEMRREAYGALAFD